jgi:CRP-like cAMP-binding protein
MDDIVAVLGETDLFGGLSKRQLELIARVTKTIDLAPGTTLITQGQNMTHMSIISTGEAVVTVDGTNVGAVGPGDVVGELSLIDDAPANASVTFEDGGTVWHLARAGFIPVWDKNRAEISTSMLFAVTKKLREADKRLAD